MSDLSTLEGVRFHTLRNALYHTARRQVLERRNRFFNLLVILLGTAAAADAAELTGVDGADVWLGIATAAVGSVQLVFDWGGRARTHQGLQKEYYQILAQAEAIDGADTAAIKSLAGDLTKIYADEPPTVQVADAEAHNAACQTMGGGYGDLIKISIFMRVIGFLFPSTPFEWKTYEEVERDARRRWHRRLLRRWYRSLFK
ncbi:hypothetical protein [Xanthobacter sp. 126]|uniref:hypothetical protein n=1 Tax=Xanthobacter sp. 126 TaxID=1131814 RepID=UPI0012DD2FBC|nr:hypothetical protein [Xanthobacter sp. 126]